VKLPRLDTDNQRRREIAQYYIRNITNQRIVLPSASIQQPASSNIEHVWHLFVIRTINRDNLQNYLYENGVQTLIHYPIPPHRQLAYNELNNLKLPITETIHNEVLSLPISPVMSMVEVRLICDLINNYR
jgi:dTDP-4-amino-4,6-dideoxygalactose transaminase